MLTPGRLGDVAGSAFDGVVSSEELGPCIHSTSTRYTLSRTNASVCNGFRVRAEDQRRGSFSERLQTEDRQVLMIQVFVVYQDVIRLVDERGRFKLTRMTMAAEKVTGRGFVHSTFLTTGSTQGLPSSVR